MKKDKRVMDYTHLPETADNFESWKWFDFKGKLIALVVKEKSELFVAIPKFKYECFNSDYRKFFNSLEEAIEYIYHYLKYNEFKIIDSKFMLLK